MLWVYGDYKYFYSYFLTVRGSNSDVRLLRLLKSIPARLAGLRRILATHNIVAISRQREGFSYRKTSRLFVVRSAIDCTLQAFEQLGSGPSGRADIRNLIPQNLDDRMLTFYILLHYDVIHIGSL